MLETIGRGGFGVVVRAFDRKLQRSVAIKLLQPGLAAAPARTQFMREARSAAAVESDHVVRIYTVDELPVPHLVMEYVRGGSLQKLLANRGPLPLREVLRIGSQIARGLAAAHATGLIHRDIKPANVLLDAESGRAKLTDFGLALPAADAGSVESGVAFGTPMYMAPEQARGELLDHRADLFSLGSVLYAMVSGCAPFAARESRTILQRVSHEVPRPVRELRPQVPLWLSALIERLHASDPAERYQSAVEVADLLEQRAAKLPARVRWFPVLALLAVVLAVLGVALTVRAPSTARPGQPGANDAPATIGLLTPAKPVADFTNSLGIGFMRIPAGEATLGGGGGQPHAHRVGIPADFYLGACEVTHDEWERVMGPGTNPSRYSRTGTNRAHVADVPDAELKRFPVDGVSWDDCQEFVYELNCRSAEPGWVYRLAKQSEWEYACRGGPGQTKAELACAFFAGEPSADFSPNRWNGLEAGRQRPVAVGSYPPNRLGLYDLHGNVFELLEGSHGENRELAGGCWLDGAEHCRAAAVFAAHRADRTPGAGFRIARVPTERALPTDLETVLSEAIAELRRRNPQFKGTVTPKIVQGRCIGLAFGDAAELADLTPVRRLRNLESFEADNTRIADLGPFRGLPLRHLALNGNTVLHDLAPLRGLPLVQLSLWGFQGDDLTPLTGMKLTYLNCGGGGKRIDLTPLHGMPLTTLGLNMTRADDLSPLTGMPLELLMIGPTRITDLSPLATTKLKRLFVEGSPVIDFRPIRTLPLEVLGLDFVAERDAEILRSIPTLQQINRKPAAEFWKAVGPK